MFPTRVKLHVLIKTCIGGKKTDINNRGACWLVQRPWVLLLLLVGGTRHDDASFVKDKGRREREHIRICSSSSCCVNLKVRKHHPYDFGTKIYIPQSLVSNLFFYSSRRRCLGEPLAIFYPSFLSFLSFLWVTLSDAYNVCLFVCLSVCVFVCCKHL